MSFRGTPRPGVPSRASTSGRASPDDFGPTPEGSPSAGGDWRSRLFATLQPALRVAMTPETRSPTAPSPPPLAHSGPSLVLPSSLIGEKASPPQTPPLAPATPGRPPPTHTVLLTWGDNNSGQLGVGDFSTRILPKAVEYFKSTELGAVVCGSRSTLALDSDGKVFAWGQGEDGTLGLGGRGTVQRPRLVEGLLRQDIVAMACRGSHVLAITERGQLWAWGRNEDGQLAKQQLTPKPSAQRSSQQPDSSQRPRNTAAAASRSLSPTRRQTQAQQQRQANGYEPERVVGLMGVAVRHIACGRCHSIAVDANGGLHSWGGGDDGALGHGDTAPRYSPAPCEALAGTPVVDVACGSRHTLALGADGVLYSWGWGVYGQLGHGDVAGRLSPTPVATLRGASLRITQLACGYRHSMVLVRHDGPQPPAAPAAPTSSSASSAAPAMPAAPAVVWAWGWGRHGQLGTGAWDDEVLPQRVEALGGVGVRKLCLGGRHSLALCDDGRVYAWGRDDEGQLGLGAQGGRCKPTLVEALRSNSTRIEVVDAALGWAHTALLVRVPLTPRDPKAAGRGRGRLSKRRRGPRLFVMADLEGLFGQLLGTSIQFMLIERLLRLSCGFDSATLHRELMPGAASVYLCGHLFFAAQAMALARRTAAPVTALPQGINIVIFFAFTQLIMAPTYRVGLVGGLSRAEASRAAYDAGRCACVLLALLELAGAPFVGLIRRAIPRAAMLSAIAGVSLTFIAMGFAVQIFAAPATALVSMLLMLLFYAGQVKLPLKIPGGILAVFVGWVLAAISDDLGYTWFTPPVSEFSPTLELPHLQLDFLSTFLKPEFYRCISVVLPMWLVNLVNNLANIEAAEAVGDEYSAGSSLLGVAVINLFCALLGNPFPSCVYIGHSAFKAMGCRVGYLYLNMVPTAFFGCLQGAGLLQKLFPIESGVGFLLWIGLQITASGFEGDQTPEGWRHGPAVALGLIPSISAWCWQSIETTFIATRDLLCDVDAGGGSVPATPPPGARWECSMDLHQIIQGASAPMAASGPLAVFQHALSSLFLSGMFALANGYLLSAIILSSMLVHIIDGSFHLAAVWLLLAAAASALGIIHSRTLDPWAANQLFPLMYLLAAVALLICHALQNREEQLRELHNLLAQRLLSTCDALLPALPRPLRLLCGAIGRHLGPLMPRRRSSPRHLDGYPSSFAARLDLFDDAEPAHAYAEPDRADAAGGEPGKALTSARESFSETISGALGSFADLGGRGRSSSTDDDGLGGLFLGGSKKEPLLADAQPV